MLALFLLAACQTNNTTQFPDRLVKLDDVHAFADPYANVCTDDADWAFFSEGGNLTYFDFRAIDVNQPGASTQVPGTTFEYELSTSASVQLKTVQIGSVGVRASEMLVHPDIDLSDDIDAPTGPDPTEDADDLIFIAGGRMGLWAMEAHPDSSYTGNRAVRIDDSGNLNPATQNGFRHCNGLAYVTVGTTDYLVALHSKN